MMEIENKQKPLASICVITYNSAKTIEETLNSAYEQTYENLELVISDDHSVDNTIEICNAWIEQHKNRFKRTQVITVEKNTGTNKNVNRVFKAAIGVWLKLLSGDDILMPKCVERLIDYCVENEKEVCISKVEYFGDEERILQKTITYESFYERYHLLSVKEKYNLLLYHCILPTPSMIISKELLERIGYLDESYTIYEEWPLLLTILECGVDIPYIEERLVRYRCESNSLSSKIFNKNKKGETYRGASYIMYQDSLRFYKSYRKPRLLKQFRLLNIWDQETAYKIRGIMMVPNRTVLQKLTLLLYRLIAPGTYRTIFKYFQSAPSRLLLRKIQTYLNF